MSPTQLVIFLQKVLPTLAEFHKQSVLHRDIKPSSIYLHIPLHKLTMTGTDIMYHTVQDKYFLIDFSVTKFIEDGM